jgi:hydroxyethylthiazole kinase
MLSALTGAFCAANPDALLEATTACFVLFGMAGEIAYEQTKAVGKGIGSLHTALLDAAEHLMQTQSKAEWEGRAKIDGQKEV